MSLFYFLWDRVRQHSTKDWPFSKRRPHWLYDEIDLADGKRFIHRVLLSDGRVIEVPFTSAMIHRLPLTESDGSKVRKRSA